MKGAAAARAPPIRKRAAPREHRRPRPRPGPARGGGRKAGGRAGGRGQAGRQAWPFCLISAPRRPLPASIFCSEGRSWSGRGAGAEGTERGTVWGREGGRTAFLHQREVLACLGSGHGRGPSGPVALLTLPVIVHYASRVALIKGL